MARASTRNRNSGPGRDAPRVPREHGFWALLGISLAAAVLMAPTYQSGIAALIVALLTIVAAMTVGRRIRKNRGLQMLASLAIATTVVPVVLAGGGTLGDAAFLAGPLGVAYLSGTLCVQAVLERAKKRHFQARAASVGSVGLATIGAAIGYVAFGPLPLLALGVTTAYATTALALQPRAKRLKLIGISIAVAHVCTALLLAL